MTDSGTVTLWAAGIAAGSALVGVWVGHVFGKRSEHQQWLRNQRMVTCQEFYVLLQHARRESWKKYKGELQDPKDYDDVERGYFPDADVATLTVDLDHAAAVMNMYATEELQYRASEAVTFYRWYIDMPATAKMKKLREMREGFDYNANAVEEAIRKELKINSGRPPLKSRWRNWRWNLKVLWARLKRWRS